MRIGVDICGTIANVYTPLAGYLLKKGDYRAVVETIRSYYHPSITPQIFKENPSIFSSAKPYKGAARQLRALAKKHELFYVTARPEWAREITQEWLDKHGFPKAPLIMGRPKPQVIEELGIELMVEDAPHEIKGLKDKCRVMVRKQPYNLRFSGRFTWKQGVAI